MNDEENYTVECWYEKDFLKMKWIKIDWVVDACLMRYDEDIVWTSWGILMDFNKG